MTKMVPLPKYDDLFKPTLEVLTSLGGSASIEELDEAMIAAIGATQDQLDVIYPKSGAAVLPDRMSWARSHLKLPGFVTNPKRGVWVLTEEGRAAAQKSNAELKQIVNGAYKASLAAKKAAQALGESGINQESGEGAVGWSDQLLQRVQTIAPDGNYPPPWPVGDGDQALTVPRMVAKTPTPGVRRAVSTTVRTSASPWAAHMAR